METSLPILIQPINSPAVAAVSQNPTAGGTTNIVPTLTDLSLGMMLTGNVTQPKNAQGHVVISTEKGDLALKTDIPMKRGIEVVIRLEKTTDELMAKIISIDSKSVAKYVESIQYQTENEDVITRSNLLQEEGTAQTSVSGDSGKASVTQQTILKAVLVALPPVAATTNPTSTNPPTLPSPPIITIPAALEPSQGMATAAPRVMTQQGMMPLLSGAKLNLTVNTIQLPPNVPHTALDSTTATTPHIQPQSTKQQPLRSAIASGIAAYRNLMGTAPSPLPQTTPTSSPLATVPTPSLLPSTPSQATPTTPSQSVAPAQPFPPVTTSTSLPTPLPADAQTPSASPLPTPQTPHIIHTPTPPPQISNIITPPLEPAITTPLSHQPATTPTMSTPEPPVSTTIPQPTQISSTLTSTPPASLPSLPHSLPSASHPFIATADPIEQHPNLIQATVIQSEENGDMTLHSNVGTLRLFSPTPLPTGSILLLNIQQVENPVSPDIAPTDSNTRTPKFSGMESLIALIPPATTPITDPSAIARIGKEMLNDIAFLFAVIKGGDMKKWLGEKTLKQLSNEGKTELLARLSSEFQTLKNVQTEPKEAGGWQHYMIPVQVDGNVEAVRFFHRHQENQQEHQQHNEKEGQKPRMEATDHFIVGVELSHLGELQLDGFIRKATSTPQEPRRTAFELVVRSAQPLPIHMQSHIRDIFINAQEITGFTGNLAFRSGHGACLLLPQTGAITANAMGMQSLIV